MAIVEYCDNITYTTDKYHDSIEYIKLVNYFDQNTSTICVIFYEEYSNNFLYKENHFIFKYLKGISKQFHLNTDSFVIYDDISSSSYPSLFNFHNFKDQGGIICRFKTNDIPLYDNNFIIQKTRDYAHDMLLYLNELITISNDYSYYISFDITEKDKIATLKKIKPDLDKNTKGYALLGTDNQFMFFFNDEDDLLYFKLKWG